MNNNPQQYWGFTIRRELKERNIGQNEFAEMIGISKQDLSNIIRKRNPGHISDEIINKIVDVLGLESKEMLQKRFMSPFFFKLNTEIDSYWDKTKSTKENEDYKKRNEKTGYPTDIQYNKDFVLETILNELRDRQSRNGYLEYVFRALAYYSIEKSDELNYNLYQIFASVFSDASNIEKFENHLHTEKYIEAIASLTNVFLLANLKGENTLNYKTLIDVIDAFKQ